MSHAATENKAHAGTNGCCESKGCGCHGPGTGRSSARSKLLRICLFLMVGGVVFVAGAYANWARWDATILARFETVLNSVSPGDIDDALAVYPFLERDATGAELVTRSGDWDVEGDLVLPNNVPLTVKAGTKLRFQPGAFVLATAAIHLRGRPGNPVVLEPQSESWGGVLVSKARDDSVWQNATIRSTGGIDRNGQLLTGAVSFHKSNVYLTKCCFEGTKAEDALNVKQADVRMTECEFSKCASDAFDGDWVTGRADRCRFDDLGNDAIDITGSRFAISYMVASNVADKAVSAGEDSHVTIDDITVYEARIGVSCTDSSVTRVYGASISNTKTGLTAWNRKAYFGPARIVAQEVVLDDATVPVLVRDKSSILLDGEYEVAQTASVEQSGEKNRRNGEL